MDKLWWMIMNDEELLKTHDAVPTMSSSSSTAAAAVWVCIKSNINCWFKSTFQTLSRLVQLLQFSRSSHNRSIRKNTHIWSGIRNRCVMLIIGEASFSIWCKQVLWSRVHGAEINMCELDNFVSLGAPCITCAHCSGPRCSSGSYGSSKVSDDLWWAFIHS